MELNVTERTVLGKKVNRLRKEGIIPAELFGPGFENKHLSVPEKAFVDIFKEAGKNTIIDLKLGNKNETVPVLIHNVHIHPLTRQPLVIDFYRIKMDKKIQTEIPIEFTGTVPVTDQGFVVVKVLNEIEVEAFPQHIPHTIKVDLSKLEREGDTIYVKDLALPQNIEVITPFDTAVVTTSEQRGEEEEVAATPPVEEVEITEEKIKEETEKEKEAPKSEK